MPTKHWMTASLWAKEDRQAGDLHMHTQAEPAASQGCQQGVSAGDSCTALAGKGHPGLLAQPLLNRKGHSLSTSL